MKIILYSIWILIGVYIDLQFGVNGAIFYGFACLIFVIIMSYLFDKKHKL